MSNATYFEHYESPNIIIVPNMSASNPGSPKRRKVENSIIAPRVENTTYQVNESKQELGQMRAQCTFINTKVDTKNISSSKTPIKKGSWASNYLERIGLDVKSSVRNYKIPKNNTSQRCVTPVKISELLPSSETINSVCRSTDVERGSQIKKPTRLIKIEGESDQKTNNMTQIQETIKVIRNNKVILHENSSLKNICVVKPASITIPKSYKNNYDDSTLLKRSCKTNINTSQRNYNTKKDPINNPSTSDIRKKRNSSKKSEKDIGKPTNPKPLGRQSKMKCRSNIINNDLQPLKSLELNRNKNNNDKNKSIQNKQRKVVKPSTSEDLKETNISTKLTIGEMKSSKGNIEVAKTISNKTKNKKKSKIGDSLKKGTTNNVKLSNKKFTNINREKPTTSLIKKQTCKSKNNRKIKLIINVICNNQNTINADEDIDDNKLCPTSNVDLDFLDDIDIDEIVQSLETTDMEILENKEISVQMDSSHNVNHTDSSENVQTDTIDLLKILKGEEDDDLIGQCIVNTKDSLVCSDLYASHHHTEKCHHNMLVEDGKTNISRTPLAMPFTIKKEEKMKRLLTETKKNELGSNDSQTLKTIVNCSCLNNCERKLVDEQNIQILKLRDINNKSQSQTQQTVNTRAVRESKQNFNDGGYSLLDVENLKNDIDDVKHKCYMKGTEINISAQKIVKRETLCDNNDIKSGLNLMKTENSGKHETSKIENEKKIEKLKLANFTYLNENKNIVYRDPENTENIHEQDQNKLKNDHGEKKVALKTESSVNLDNLNYFKTETVDSGNTKHFEKCDDNKKAESVNDEITNSTNKIKLTKNTDKQRQKKENDETKNNKILQFDNDCKITVCQTCDIDFEKNEEKDYENYKQNISVKHKEINVKPASLHENCPYQNKDTRNNNNLNYKKAQDSLRQIDITDLMQEKNNRDYKPNCDNYMVKEKPKSPESQLQRLATKIEAYREDNDEKQFKGNSKNCKQVDIFESQRDILFDTDGIDYLKGALSSCHENKSDSEQEIAIKLEEKMFMQFGIHYSITSIIHNGKFSNILKCQHPSGKYFALKMLNNNRTMNIEKKQMLYCLQNNLHKNNLHTVYLVDTFILEKKWVILMDYYPQNLAEILKKNKTPFCIEEVQDYAKQLVTALLFLKNNDMVHLDIQPKHILLNSSNNMLKLCGFDCLCYVNKMKVLPNLGSVNYRAPEVILGFKAGFEIDVWSTGLVLFEIAANKKLFPGSFNNDILFKQICTLGCVPYDMIKKSRFAFKHFDGSNFMRRFGFKGKDIKIIKAFKKNNKLYDSIYDAYFENWAHQRTTAQKTSDMKKLRIFGNLIQQMLAIHPSQRITVEFIFGHPFIYDPYEYQVW